MLDATFGERGMYRADGKRRSAVGDGGGLFESAGGRDPQYDGALALNAQAAEPGQVRLTGGQSPESSRECVVQAVERF